MAISSLTYIMGFSVRFYQPVYSVEEYYERKRITFKSSSLKPLNQIKPDLAGIVIG
jgi:hypothetical protein